MGEKAEHRQGKQGKKEKGKLGGKEQVQKRPGSVHSLSRPPAPWQAGSRGHHTASGSPPGHWLRQGRTETKGVSPCSPSTSPTQHFLPTAASTSSSEAKLGIKEDKRYLLNCIFEKNISCVLPATPCPKELHTHIKNHVREKTHLE